MGIGQYSECLTRRGWVTYNNIRVGEDETLNYDSRTKRLEWTYILNVYSYEDSRVVLLSNGPWEIITTLDQCWITDDDTIIQTADIVSSTRILTHTSSVETDVPIYLPNRRRYVTNLTMQEIDTQIAWSIATGGESWYAKYKDNQTLTCTIKL